MTTLTTDTATREMIRSYADGDSIKQIADRTPGHTPHLVTKQLREAGVTIRPTSVKVRDRRHTARQTPPTTRDTADGHSLRAGPTWHPTSDCPRARHARRGNTPESRSGTPAATPRAGKGSRRATGMQRRPLGGRN